MEWMLPIEPAAVASALALAAEGLGINRGVSTVLAVL